MNRKSRRYSETSLFLREIWTLVRWTDLSSDCRDRPCGSLTKNLGRGAHHRASYSGSDRVAWACCFWGGGDCARWRAHGAIQGISSVFSLCATACFARPSWPGAAWCVAERAWSAAAAPACCNYVLPRTTMEWSMLPGRPYCKITKRYKYINKYIYIIYMYNKSIKIKQS